MGIDVGFDLYPPLTTEDELKMWEEFLKEVESKYQNSPDLESTEDHLWFKVGEGPMLVRDGRFFRRFSSKVTGSCYPAEPYIEEVFDIAKKHFYGRVHLWHEFHDIDNTRYGWEEIHQVSKNYRAEMQKKKEKEEKESTTTNPTAAK